MDTGKYHIFLKKEEDGVIKAILPQRHNGQQQDIKFMDGAQHKFKPNHTYKLSVRVVGCCAHITSVLSYMDFK